MKFKSNIEVQAGVEDNNASTGTPGQILSSTGTGVEWINQEATSSSSNFVYFTVKNESGATIPRGAAVMAVGSDGNSGTILIDEFIADGSVEPKYFLGLMEDSIANGAFGRAVSFGEIDQINTNAFNDGDVLWTDPAIPGGLTTTEPNGPNTKLAVAIVLNSSTNGKVFCRVQGNEGVHDLHDTRIISQVDGDVLVWNETDGIWFNDSTLNVDYTNSRVGIGTTSPPSKVSISGGTLSVSGSGAGFGVVKLGDPTDANPYVGMYRSAAASIATSGNFLNLGGYDGIAFTTGAAPLSGQNECMRITSAGDVGIGTSSPEYKLHVSGTGNFSNILRISTGDQTTTRLNIKNVNSTGARTFSIVGGINGVGQNGLSIYDDDADATRLVIQNSGNISIGNTNDTYKLDVNGTGRFTSDVTANSFNGATIISGTLNGSVTGTNTGDDPFTSTKISGETLKSTLAGTEEVLINDAGTLKKTTTQDIADLGSGGGGGATGLTSFSISYHTHATTNVALTNQASTLNFFSNTNKNIKLVDLSNVSKVRLILRVGAGSTSVNDPRVLLKYNTGTLSLSTASYSEIGAGATEVSASLSTVGFADSGWINLDSGAMVDNVHLAAMMIGGNGTADPNVMQIDVYFKN